MFVLTTNSSRENAQIQVDLLNAEVIGWVNVFLDRTGWMVYMTAWIDQMNH